MRPGDDLEDGKSREANRRFLTSVDRRTIRFMGHWMPRHPYQPTLWDNLMSILGAIILAAVLIGLLVEHFARR